MPTRLIKNGKFQDVELLTSDLLPGYMTLKQDFDVVALEPVGTAALGAAIGAICEVDGYASYPKLIEAHKAQMGARN